MSKHELAFPSPRSALGSHNGMSLRDYFAAKAMQAALTHPCAGGAIETWIADNARFAYVAADAMLEARANSLNSGAQPEKA